MKKAGQQPGKAPKPDVLVLSGFLGAGKTTLIRHLMSVDEDMSGTVILVNEFGETGIDGTLLAEGGSRVVELASGCICCTLGPLLRPTVEQLLDDFKPGRILMEPSGVAEPGAVISALQTPGLRERLGRIGVAALMDVTMWQAIKVLGRIFFSQLAAAEVVLLNKIDLVDEAEAARVRDEIQAFVPDRRVLPVSYGRVAPAELWARLAEGGRGAPLSPLVQILGPDTSPGLAPAGAAMGQPDPELNFFSFVYRDKAALDPAALEALLKELPWEVFRVKGPVKTPTGTRLLNYVNRNLNWEDWSGPEATELVFITWNMDLEKILVKLENCRAKEG